MTKTVIAGFGSINLSTGTIMTGKGDPKTKKKKTKSKSTVKLKRVK